MRDRRFCRAIAPITKSGAKHHLGCLPFGWIVLCTMDFQSVGQTYGLKVRSTVWYHSRFCLLNEQTKSVASHHLW